MLALLLVAAGGQVEAADNLTRQLRSASRDGDYVSPATHDVEQAETLFQRCFSQCNDAAVRQEWQQLGFEMEETEHGGQTLVVIREKTDARLGRGFYAFRPKSTSTTVLQAPHSFKDEHTREILLHLLAEGDFRAAAWNTVPRHYKRGGMKVDADLAHLDGSYFLAFSRAFARQYGGGKLVQLHGFEQGKRRSNSGANAEIIVSSGREEATPEVLKTGACLKHAGLGDVRIYPAEIRELGATTNSSGKALIAMGHAGFVHVEMSAQTRAALLNDNTERARLLRCLEQ